MNYDSMNMLGICLMLITYKSGLPQHLSFKFFFFLCGSESQWVCENLIGGLADLFFFFCFFFNNLAVQWVCDTPVQWVCCVFVCYKCFYFWWVSGCVCVLGWAYWWVCLCVLCSHITQVSILEISILELKLGKKTI